MSSKVLPRIAASIVILFFVGVSVLAAPHARSIHRMIMDMTMVYRFQKRIASPEFRSSCGGWETKGLSDCLVREVDEANLLDEATSARRVMLHGAVVTALGKAYRDQWDSRYRAYSDAILFLDHDLAQVEKRFGKVIALNAHDPAADEVFHPARVEKAEERAMRSLNGRLMNTYRERTARMKSQGVSENLSGAQWEKLHAAYALLEKWEKRVQWETP